ncbi:MAG TPA: hypothetical protein ACFYD1_06460 [Candidatus Hypogeohydataceae bacterium YC38]|nr:hypothetical protein [Candidatus Brocadiales bacterium]
MLEDILKQIRALLQNQLPAKLDQIELERADGMALEDIQSFLIHEDGRHKYPSVTILGEITKAANALSRRRELRHEIFIWVTHREVAPDSELPQIRLWRYVEAIERILAFDPTLGGKVMDSDVTNHRYLLKGREGFINVAVLSLEALERPSTDNY